MEKEKSIRSFGAEFVMSSELSQGKKEMSFIARCKNVGVDNDDRAIYGNKTEKTVLAASQLKRPYGLDKEENPEFPETVSFEVDEKHRLIF